MILELPGVRRIHLIVVIIVENTDTGHENVQIAVEKMCASNAIVQGILHENVQTTAIVVVPVVPDEEAHLILVLQLLTAVVMAVAAGDLHLHRMEAIRLTIRMLQGMVIGAWILDTEAADTTMLPPQEVGADLRLMHQEASMELHRRHPTARAMAADMMIMVEHHKRRHMDQVTAAADTMTEECHLPQITAGATTIRQEECHLQITTARHHTSRDIDETE